MPSQPTHQIKSTQWQSYSANLHGAHSRSTHQIYSACLDLLSNELLSMLRSTQQWTTQQIYLARTHYLRSLQLPLKDWARVEHRVPPEVCMLSWDLCLHPHIFFTCNLHLPLKDWARVEHQIPPEVQTIVQLMYDLLSVILLLCYTTNAILPWP